MEDMDGYLYSPFPPTPPWLVWRISGTAQIYYTDTPPNEKFSLYLKKAGIASRNIVHF